MPADKKSLSKAARLQRREIPDLPLTENGLRSTPAWMFSLLLHIILLVSLGLLWSSQTKGTGGEPDRPVGVAVVYEVAGEEAYHLSDAGERDSEQALQAALVSEQSAADASLAAAQQALLADLSPGNLAAGTDTDAAAGGIGLSSGGGGLSGSRDAPKLKTEVFGVEGEGTRFLYVFDRSDSMNGWEGAPLRAAKRELLRSIESMGDVHQFQIVFYNEAPLPLGGLSAGGPQLLRGDSRSKQEARRFVRDVAAIGGTRHLAALRMALAMSPDVVFFLTDADAGLSRANIEDLHNSASRVGATIHAIQFGVGPERQSANWSQSLAAGTGGSYRYIDVASLR